MNEIPTAEFLKQLSGDGQANYEKDVLNGPLFKKIIAKIEDSALDGYTGWRQSVDRHDDVRALKVIQKELQSKGFHCEFETENKQGLLGAYKLQYFSIKWG
ncbi:MULTISPECIES: hypothetical protein [Lysinibacillus]|uniref:hypothetical protein n=1 Tax=Lysinibacillus TaxID=400634 RepID=UPI0004D9E75F|nr:MULTISPECIES: hypothetical protein [Lysinibacillus]AJK89667.1 hypothetical protein HR49_22225 [Lysinibacillus fusiformis]KHK54319.1 hypothetical protein PI85_05835 [Lysinibacillus sp. A1]